MKEKVVISYSNGITHSPSDLVCSDGELEECINLEVRNGELMPMEMPVKLVFTLASGEKLVLVHNIKTGGKNYFTLSSGVLKAFHIVDGAKEPYNLSVNCGEITSIQSIGNTVVVYTPDSPHYILYKDNHYIYLGSNIPEVDISFDLSGEFRVGEIFEITTPDADKNSDEYQSSVTEGLIAEANKFIAEQATGDNKFMFPFFVRYALRLFDGTNIHHSSPVLMYPSTNLNPSCVCVRGTRDVDMRGRTYKCQIGGMVSSLEYTIMNSSSDLSKWTDIIRGIDICVSRQIYNYDQNGSKFGTTTAAASEFVGKYEGSSSIWKINSLITQKSTLEVGSQEYLSHLYLPVRDLDDIYAEIKNTSLFYKVSFIDASSINNGSTDVVNGNFKAVEVGETLKDDYMTHDSFIPKSSFVYNSRLNISNVRRVLFDGFRVDCMVQMFKNTPVDNNFYFSLEYGSFYAYVYIRNTSVGEDIIVKSPLSSYGGIFAPYFFYPDTDAYKMVIVNSSGSKLAEILLSEHTGLNGAYYFGGFTSLFFLSISKNIQTTDKEEVFPNKLFTSELNNPFHFPLEGIYTVGSGEIIGMTAVTRPISQGQFGEFPMMMFCSDGNYAMKVDAEGFYERISPIQEDIVLGNDKITPMEDSVVVITKKGLMLSQGGEIVKLASQMDGGVIDLSLFKGIETSISEISKIVNKAKDNTSFLSYLYGSRMAFDYASNRLFIYNREKNYSYVYNFNNNTISKLLLGQDLKIETSVIDYPDVIIQDQKGNLYSLYDKNDISTQSTRYYGMIFTRPLKMGGPLTLKSIRQIMLLATYNNKESFVKYLLYGSNDNVSYYQVSSRFGKPYKYYRLAIYTNLLPKESFSGTAITIEERRTGKLR